MEHCMKRPRLLLARGRIAGPVGAGIRRGGHGGRRQSGFGNGRKTSPELILLDISMPGLNGIEAARRLEQSNPERN
jgi:CheY-like chemotaxis protein